MTKKTRWIAAALAVVLAVGAGGYAASPYLAVQGLKSAVQRGDRDKLDAMVDFPAVRESLKAQLNLQIAAYMAADQDLKDNPFAGFAQLLSGAIVQKLVDTLVTPEGLARMIETGKAQDAVVPSPASPTPPPAPAPSSKGGPKQRAGYTDLNVFKVWIRPPDEPVEKEFSLVLRRTGLVSWRLVRIDLPKDLMKDAPKA